ncbi:hypothetical protein MRX96_015672 [Rhipicephalus microplus]
MPTSKCRKHCRAASFGSAPYTYRSAPAFRVRLRSDFQPVLPYGGGEREEGSILHGARTLSLNLTLRPTQSKSVTLPRLRVFFFFRTRNPFLIALTTAFLAIFFFLPSRVASLLFVLFVNGRRVPFPLDARASNWFRFTSLASLCGPCNAKPNRKPTGLECAVPVAGFRIACYFFLSLDPAALKNGGGGKQTLQQPLTPSCDPPPSLVDSARYRGRRQRGVHPVRDLRGGGRQREGRKRSMQEIEEHA